MFKGRLRVVHINGKVWELTSNLTYEHHKYGKIVVPKGFKTDFASIPRIALSVTGSPAGQMVEASVVHDWLYSISNPDCELDRKQADKVFLRILRKSGVSKLKSKTMYRMVRMFGGLSYREKKDWNK